MACVHGKETAFGRIHDYRICRVFQQSGKTRCDLNGDRSCPCFMDDGKIVEAAPPRSRTCSIWKCATASRRSWSLCASVASVRNSPRSSTAHWPSRPMGEPPTMRRATRSCPIVPNGLNGLPASLMGGEKVNGIDYKVRYYPLNGVPFWSYHTYRNLEQARNDAEEAVRVIHALYQGYRPVLKTEVRAGDRGQCVSWPTVVETYRRTDPIYRPDLYKFHGMCGQMLY